MTTPYQELWGLACILFWCCTISFLYVISLEKNASEMHCLIEILYLHAYCFCCKLCKMCQSSFFSNSPQILWGLADEGCNLVCQIEIPWLLLLYRGRMLHKSQNEVASQLFLLHSYHQSKIYGCQSRIRAPLHADIICAVLCYHAAFR